MAAAIFRTLARSPSERFATADELAAALIGTAADVMLR
jgi:hypothetical protein